MDRGSDAPVTLAEVAAELYGLPPAQFTAARTARAKALRAAGDRDVAGQVQSLRRPTLAAWGVNLLVRHRPDDVSALLGLGGRLLHAQAAGDGDALRELDRSRHAAMAALRDEAHRLAEAAGQRLGTAADVPLESTLRAAMTDPTAAAAVRSGLLVGDLVSTGFGPVDVDGAVAVPDAPPLTGGPAAPEPAPPAPGADDAPTIALSRRAARRPATSRGTEGTRTQGARTQGTPTGGTRTGGTRTQGTRTEGTRTDTGHEGSRAEDRRAVARRLEREHARTDLDVAQARAVEAERALVAARAEAEDLTRRRAALDAEVARLAAELADAETRQRSAAVAERRARTAQDAASRAAATAARRAGAAQERLDALED